MRIVTPPLIVEENDSFENDALDRKPYGEALLNLIERSSDELVISLDGKWGEGKTTFIKMWRGLLNESNIQNIYIDAFSNDYIDDAFITIASAITSYAKDNIKKDSEKYITEVIENAANVGGQLLSWTAKVGIKTATLGALKDSDFEELKNIKDDLAKGVSGLIGDLIEERLVSHSKDIELITSFKDLLSNLPSQLEGDVGKPLVIIIDELDRCKPTFAVEILEKVKHLFSVQNVVFVLVMHKEQLEESVRCIYGQNIDAHTYLQKFINMETKIPKKIEALQDNDLINYSRRLLELHELETWGDNNNIIDFIEPLAKHFNLSLRQLEKVFTNLAIFYGTSKEEDFRQVVTIIIFLSVIKVINPPLFEHLLYQRLSFKDVCNETKLSTSYDERGNERRLNWLMMWIRFSLLSEEEFQQVNEQDRIKSFGESLWSHSIEREGLIPFLAWKLNLFVVN